MGVKNVKHLIHFLANDDIASPTALVGKKIAPIFVSLMAVEADGRLCLCMIVHCFCMSAHS